MGQSDGQRTGPEADDGVRAGILHRYDFYRQARAALREEILKHAQPMRVPTGTVVFEPGGRCGAVSLIGSGSVRVFVSSEAGREVTLYHVGAGETCPVNLLTALLSRTPPAKAVIEETVEAVMVPSDRFREWMDTEDVVRTFVLDAMAQRFVEVMEQIQEITFGRLDQRLIEFLSRRFDHGLEIRITHEQIAVELSTAREVVSRLLREFERRGALDLGRGRVTLKDLALLERFGGMARRPGAGC